MERATPLSGAGAVLAVLGLVGLAAGAPPASTGARASAGDGGVPSRRASPAHQPPPEHPASQGASPAAGALLDGKPLDVNVASARDLQLLPGIGPALAGRIVAERRTAGPFGSLGELERVRGIGPKTVEALRGLAHAGPASGDKGKPDQAVTDRK